MAFKAAEYQRLNLPMPKSFISSFKPPTSNSDKISKNKKKKLKKKAKRQKVILEQNLKEFTSIDSEQQINEQQESLNGLKDFNLEDDADACSASVEEVHEKQLNDIDTDSKSINSNQNTLEIEKHKLDQMNDNNNSKLDSNLHKTESITNETKNNQLNNNIINNNQLKNTNNQNNDNIHIENNTNPSTNTQLTGHQGNDTTINFNQNMTNNFSIIFEEIQQHYQKSSSNERKPDPSIEVCNVNVKIADLGNGCWVVSFF